MQLFLIEKPLVLGLNAIVYNDYRFDVDGLWMDSTICHTVVITGLYILAVLLVKTSAIIKLDSYQNLSFIVI